LHCSWRDGYGEKIDTTTLETATLLLKLFVSKGIEEPDFGPSEEGEVVFEWRKSFTILTIQGFRLVMDIVYENVVETTVFDLGRLDSLYET